MGKSIAVSDLSFTSTNLSQVTYMGLNSSNVFKITAEENLTLSFSNDLLYNDGSTVSWKYYEANTELELNNGDSIAFKGSLVPTQENGIGTFEVSGNFIVSGNLLELINYEQMRSYQFKNLFKNCTTLTDASNLILDDYTVQNCYEGMFYGCTSLESAPVLSSAILTLNCYKEIFYGCSSLNELNVYCAMQLGESYSYNWVYGVSSIGTFKQTPNITYTESGVHGIPSTWEVDKSYKSCYFTIQSLEDNNNVSVVKVNNCILNPEFHYSLDNGITWNSVILDDEIKNIGTINTGEYIIFSSINDCFGTAWDTYNKFSVSKSFEVHGNIMSLLFGNNFANNSEFASGTKFSFTGLFTNNINLIDASNLILPALTCVTSCYNGMFKGCLNLTTSPELPATISAQDCFSSMFESCINLEEAPAINLTNLSATCCKNMFAMSRTEKLMTPKMTKSPILRVAAGANNCYLGMFQGNGNLIEVTCLLTSWMGTADWLKNCSDIGTFIKDPNATWSTGTSGIPSGWTIVDYTE